MVGRDKRLITIKVPCFYPATPDERKRNINDFLFEMGKAAEQRGQHLVVWDAIEDADPINVTTTFRYFFTGKGCD